MIRPIPRFALTSSFTLLGAFTICFEHGEPCELVGERVEERIEERAESRIVPSPRFDPVIQKMHGWTVHVDPALLEGPDRVEGSRALSMLANHLERIAILLGEPNPGPLKKLKEMEIWIEREHPKLANMQYHPSKRWLVNNGHDPRLAKKVHIPRARALLSKSQMLKHPAVVLHELAHAYHDQVLGFGEKRIIAAFAAARAAKTYLLVMAHTGRRVRHYALSNHKEYFAEGTEAYLYRNDFYPFVRAELKQHDPRLHTLLREIWGRVR